MNEQQSNPSQRRSRAGTLAIVLALVALVAMGQLRGGGATTIPQELLGTWTTTAPDYAGRAVELTPTTLSLYTGAPLAHAYSVRRVVRVVRGGSALYTIEYEREGEEESMSLLLVQAAQPVIRIEHQNFVWRRRPQTAPKH